MNVSRRLLISVAVGFAVAIVGFLLTLDLWDLGTVVMGDGTRFGVTTDRYIFLGKVLLCTGIAVSAISFLMWAKCASMVRNGDATL